MEKINLVGKALEGYNERMAELVAARRRARGSDRQPWLRSHVEAPAFWQPAWDTRSQVRRCDGCDVEIAAETPFLNCIGMKPGTNEYNYSLAAFCSAGCLVRWCLRDSAMDREARVAAIEAEMQAALVRARQAIIAEHQPALREAVKARVQFCPTCGDPIVLDPPGGRLRSCDACRASKGPKGRFCAQCGVAYELPVGANIQQRVCTRHEGESMPPELKSRVASPQLG